MSAVEQKSANIVPPDDPAGCRCLAGSVPGTDLQRPQGHDEPPHVHVERENRTCKFWLEPLGLARSHGFSARELNVIRRIILTHFTAILEAWYEHCG